MTLETVIYRGWTICYCEDRRRRFWSTRDIREGAWGIAQEFCTLDDARNYVDARIGAR
jgi:hypothetical protein